MSDNRHQAALSKTLTLLALGTFVALASLTASLPLNLPRSQVYKSASYLDPLYPSLNNGDTAWMIVATIFGLFLGPALAYLYALLNGHDTAHAIKTVVLAESLITTLWVVFSFSLIYGKDANGDQILGFPATYYMFRDVGPAPDNDLAPTIPLSIFAIFELGFAIVTATLVAVSVLGRVNLTGFLFFIFAWHLTIYAPTAHIVWHPKGWFRNYHIEDFAGGIVVNMLASVTIIVLHLILGREGTPKTKPTSHASLALSALLTVWFLWFGFNSGKAHNAGSVATQSIVNTIGGTTSAVLTWYFLDLLFERTTTSVTIVNAVLLGLVATTPSSGYLTVGGSMALAIWTVLIVFFVSVIGLGEAKEANEPLSIVSIHGIGGTISFVFTAFISYQFINPDAQNGLTYGRGIPLAYQIAAALVIWFCTFVAVGLLAFLSNLIVPLGLPSDAPAEQAAQESNGEKSADAVEASKAEVAEAQTAVLDRRPSPRH